MKQQIFFIVGSLGAGGSERVYWLLSQYFNERGYRVSLIYLNGNETCFSTNIPGINFIDLKTVKASRSFFKLYKIIKREKPFAVFSTTDHLNILTGLVSLFLNIPNLIARASNDPKAMRTFNNFKAKFYNLFTRLAYRKFDTIVCQTEEMASSTTSFYHTSRSKIIVIANPTLLNGYIKVKSEAKEHYHLVAVGRLAEEKGLFRLLETMALLPEKYVLTIIGTGKLMQGLLNYVVANKLENRIIFKGHCNNVLVELLKYDLMVMTSFTEGFPNALLEALSVGLPVVTFAVSGSKELIKDSFNGFVVKQGNLKELQEKIIKASNSIWQHNQIKADAFHRFNLKTIGAAYENLII
ncbi:MAG: glycosyltransferase [Pedobacter sp.]|nr:MAG: glycosyltransferase [Pedobacter sp.]